MAVLKQGCVGLTHISIRCQSLRNSDRNINLAHVFRDSSKYFTTYEKAKEYYENLRASGKHPAIFGICQNSEPDAISKGEIFWNDVNCDGSFDYVLLAKIDTGRGKQEYQWLHATGGVTEERGSFIVTHIFNWSEDRYVIWGVVNNIDWIFKKYSLTFQLPENPWKTPPQSFVNGIKNAKN